MSLVSLRQTSRSSEENIKERKGKGKEKRREKKVSGDKLEKSEDQINASPPPARPLPMFRSACQLEEGASIN